MRLPIVLTLVALALTGCSGGFFAEKGTLESVGTSHNTWKYRPQGCTRDPFDGQPVGKSRSIVTLLWGNPALRNPHFGPPGQTPDAPLRLEFMPAPGGAEGEVVATLHTLYQGGILLDKSNCRKLQLQTQERPPDRAGARPTLAGQLELDCRADTSHLTAKMRFAHCEY